MSILTVQNLSHGFGDRAIFNNVSFRLLKGEHIGLIGANGEGKSTFMNIITRQLEPDEGQVEWSKRVRVGYLDQQYGLLARNDGGTIEVNGENTGLERLGYDLDYSNDIAPYVGIGFSPAITNRWGVFGELGAYYAGNPTVSNVNYYGGTPTDVALVEEHINEVRNDDKYEWLPVAKLGVSFRF